jgi:hypothetical protein
MAQPLESPQGTWAIPFPGAYEYDIALQRVIVREALQQRQEHGQRFVMPSGARQTHTTRVFGVSILNFVRSNIRIAWQDVPPGDKYPNESQK